MKITTQSTDRMVAVNGMPARIWEGTTAGGVNIHCLIARIAVDQSADQRELEAELKEVHAPISKRGVEAFPAQLII